MSDYSKHKDINAVLKKAESDLSQIEISYNAYLKEKSIPDDLLVDVKDCIANMRSALDYVWCKLLNVSNGAHFPIANSQADFVNKVSGVDQSFVDVVEKWQSYNGNQWLSNFGYIRNKYEHLTLIPQIRKETKRVSISRGGSSVSWGSGVTFGSGVSVMGVPIDPSTQMPVPNNTAETKIEIWVDFLFDVSSISNDFPKNISVLPFLKTSLDSVKKIVQELESI